MRLYCNAAVTFLWLWGSLGHAQPQDPGRMPGPVADNDRYVVDFRDTVSRHVAVQAEVSLVGGRLHVERNTRQAPGFWRSLVRGLAVADPSGRPLAIDSVSPTEWAVGDGYTGRATLRYVVDYSFATRPFPSGNQKGGLLTEGGLYLVTKPLFLTPDTGDVASSRRVEVRVPAGWKIVTPWLLAPAGPATSRWAAAS
jgi:hypothetical protein